MWELNIGYRDKQLITVDLQSSGLIDACNTLYYDARIHLVTAQEFCFEVMGYSLWPSTWVYQKIDLKSYMSVVNTKTRRE